MLEGIGVDEAEKERLLDQFRDYLDGIDELPEPASDPGSEEADLFSVFVELAAMRTEVRTESRLVKEALDQFRAVFDTLQSSHAMLEQELQRAQVEARAHGQVMLRPLLLELLELRDRLDAALRPPAPPPPRGWLDSWRRAPQVAPDPWREGVTIMARRLDRILSDRHVFRLDLVRQRFDPRIARVVGTRQDERFGPGTVVEEVRAGYLWDDDLLRTAEVIVSNTGAGDSEA
jgi:molecular chaperone GrpE